MWQCAFVITSIGKIYYNGTRDDYSKIKISSGSDDYFSGNSPVQGNKQLLNFDSIHYYSKTQPTGEGHYWHYDENDQIVEW